MKRGEEEKLGCRDGGGGEEWEIEDEREEKVEKRRGITRGGKVIGKEGHVGKIKERKKRRRKGRRSDQRKCCVCQFYYPAQFPRVWWLHNKKGYRVMRQGTPYPNPSPPSLPLPSQPLFSPSFSPLSLLLPSLSPPLPLTSPFSFLIPSPTDAPYRF